MLNLSAGDYRVRPTITLSYEDTHASGDSIYTYVDEWDAIALDWTISYKEYME